MGNLLKKSLLLLLSASLIVMTGCGEIDDDTVRIKRNNTWVVIMEMGDYPDGYQDTITDFASAKRMQKMFMKMGVEDDHMRVVLNEMQSSDVQDSLKWLGENADKDDLVFFYVTAHGGWLEREVQWEKFVSPEWLELDVRDKVLMVDSCDAGRFIEDFAEVPEAGMAFSVTSADELSWKGLEEEGLPIIGSVWSHYFVETVFDETADANGDKMITMEEALSHTDLQVNEYMRNEVFAVEEFLKMYHDLGAYPLKSETYPNPLFYNYFEKDLVLCDMN